MKDCLLLANINVITYKEVFPPLKNNILRPGVVFNKTLEFEGEKGPTKKPGIAWYTTLSTPVKDKLVLTKTYNEKDYPKYDNYPAINVDKVKDIPYDYDGVIGVPITIFKYDLDEVEIQGLSADKRNDDDWCIKGDPTYLDEKHKHFQGMVKDGKPKYARVLIKKT